MRKGATQRQSKWISNSTDKERKGSNTQYHCLLSAVNIRAEMKIHTQKRREEKKRWSAIENKQKPFFFFSAHRFRSRSPYPMTTLRLLCYWSLRRSQRSQLRRLLLN
jgi:hypothetical protein